MVAAAHRDERLVTLEQETLTTIRTAMLGLLGVVLALSTTSLQPGGVGRTVRCPGCGARTPVEGWRPRTNARMDYPTFRQQGLPLGSGAVESAGRHLVQLRMKCAGACWSDAGGQAVLNVRCRLISNRPLAA